ncbi:MAG: iron ABC transporter permease [Opitutales bacterium]|nr:iron ABC transporter permease [Opitutales bacterium]
MQTETPLPSSEHPTHPAFNGDAIDRKSRCWPTVLLVLLAISFLFSMLVGSVFLTPQRLVEGVVFGQDSIVKLIFWEIRLPRALLGVFVGFSLGLTGAVMQGYMRNPLADPGVLGVSTGAAMGAVLMFYLGAANLFALALPLGGILGGFVIIVMVVTIAGREASVQTLILAGIAFSSLASSIISLVLNLSPNPHAAMDIVFWLMGSLSDRNLQHVWLTLPLMIPGWLLLLVSARALRALSLGEETAASLGFNLRRVRSMIILGSSLAVGPAIAVSGSIGFVGLIVPHVMRPLIGNDPARLLWVSGLAGAILLTWSDLAVRLISGTVEIKLGVITALVGAPFFFFLLFRMRKEAI